MSKHAFRIVTLAMLLLSILINSIPVRATSPTALTPPQTINIAHFFKPPNMDAATAVRNFNTMVLTNGDHVYRDQLIANGFTSTIPEYLRSDGIQDPGSCTATPANNQVAYNVGDFCFISQNHPDWFLLDSNGRRITVTSGGNYYRMDPANQGWREFFLTRVVESQQTNSWTGLFLDNVEGSLSKYYGPQPVKYPDNASYQAAIQGFLQYLYVNYSQTYERPIIGNIVARDSDAVWFSYLQYLSGAMQERFAVDWDETSYLSTGRWNNDMAMMEQTQANGKYVILVAPGNQGDLNRQNFAFASYLLISNGKAAFRYSTDDAYNTVWLYDNYKVDLGSPLGPRYLIGTIWRRDFTNGYVAVDPASHAATISVVPPNSDIRISVGGTGVGGYNIPSYDTFGISYLGLRDGPVKINSQNGNNFFASERSFYGGSFNELMGYPGDQLTTEYWFPWYDNVAMSTWILVGNPTGQTANVDIYIGSTRHSYSIPSGGRITPIYPGKVDGPVRVISTNGQKIFASERALYKGSFNEVMGYPGDQLTTEYWFPWYDNVAMSTWILVGNPGSQTANVDIYIGSTKYSYNIPPGGRITPIYPGIVDGPVRVISANGQKIFTSERALYRSSFNEVMGYPSNQFTSEYWFPWYKSISMSTWILVGNPGSQTANVDIYVGSRKSSYSIPPGGRITPLSSGIEDGPVHVVSTNGQVIFASERALYGNSFNEVMGYPGDQLTTEYWFTWYDNISMSTWVMVGRP